MAAPNRFVERLENGPPIVGDGGMGALVTSAVPRLRTPEEANLRAPDAVVSLHVGFIQAGAELIETNTFGANRRKLAGHYLEDEFEQIVSAGVRLAREAREVTGSNVFIGGSIGPLGDDSHVEERAGLFSEQASILEGRGADLFMLETFFDLDELVIAVEAVRSVSSLPIVALLTFENDAETLAGVGARDAADKLRELGVSALGANHGAGLQAALRAIEQMGGDGIPLAALPNIGLASMAGGRVIYPHASPEYFAEFAAHARRLGAKIIGGCCGTTPAEIAAIRRSIDEAREPRAPLVFRERETAIQVEEQPAETTLARMLPRGRVGRLGAARPAARRLERRDARGRAGAQGHGRRPVRRHQRQPARPRADERDHERGRDRADGRARDDPAPDPARHDDHRGWSRSCSAPTPRASATSSPSRETRPRRATIPAPEASTTSRRSGSCRSSSALNRGEDFHGRAIDAPTHFFTGVAVNPTADDLELELQRFEQKLEAGAKFAMTQILFDLSYLEAFFERFGGPSPIPLLVGDLAAALHQLAQRLHNEVPGIVVPERRAAGAARRRAERARDVGAKLAHELYVARSKELQQASTSSRRSGSRSACSTSFSQRAQSPVDTGPAARASARRTICAGTP